MISAENLTKSFGSQVLLDGVGFKVNSRERVGLVGRNGHGKTTLFRMIVGEERPDDGIIVIPRNYRIGYVRQEIAFTEKSVLEEGMTALPESDVDQSWKVEKILTGLGFSETDLYRAPGEFSGGYQVRLNLAKVLVSEPDLLLLDEPTNYLDIASIRWVEQFLQNWPRELLLITHDRGFMDKLVTHTLGIHRRKVRKIPGNTERYYTQIAQEEEIHEKTRLNDERKRKEVEQFISRFRAKARLAGLVQSRIKTLEKMGKRDRLEKVKDLEFSFRSKPFPARHVLSARHVTFSYTPDRPLIQDFSISIGKGERICVVGKNGRGKTTLLKLLAGLLSPRAGEVVYNPQVVSGVFEQTNVKHLVDGRTVEEEILSSHPDIDRQLALNISGAMMFRDGDAQKKISVLSGGEKSRVMLGKLLATPVNLLLLDEPTNHLDLESCDALLAAIDSFYGVVIMVTHNEMFLHALADRLVVFQHGGIEVFEGSYRRFLEQVGWEDELTGPRARTSADSGTDPADRMTRKELRRRRSEVITERGKALKPIEKGIAETEAAIERNERELERLSAEMLEASRSGDGDRIAALGRSIHSFQTDIDRLFEELERLNDSLEKKRSAFDGRLAELNDPPS